MIYQRPYSVWFRDQLNDSGFIVRDGSEYLAVNIAKTDLNVSKLIRKTNKAVNQCTCTRDKKRLRKIQANYFVSRNTLHDMQYSLQIVAAPIVCGFFDNWPGVNSQSLIAGRRDAIRRYTPLTNAFMYR